MTVHVVAHFTIDDMEGYLRYAHAFPAILADHGGRVVTYGDEPEVLEGAHAGGRMVVIEFDDEAAFRRWWESPEYRAIATDRIDATTTHSIVLVERPPS